MEAQVQGEFLFSDDEELLLWGYPKSFLLRHWKEKLMFYMGL